MRYRSLIPLLLLLTLVLSLPACAKRQPEVVYYPVYKSLDCADAVPPELQELNPKQYISSKHNSSVLLSNFSALGLYVDRLLQQIACYKAQSSNEKPIVDNGDTK